MDQIKKKLAALKDEREAAVEKADEAEAQRKEADARAEAVRSRALGYGLGGVPETAVLIRVLIGPLTPSLRTTTSLHKARCRVDDVSVLLLIVSYVAN